MKQYFYHEWRMNLYVNCSQHNVVNYNTMTTNYRYVTACAPASGETGEHLQLAHCSWHTEYSSSWYSYSNLTAVNRFIEKGYALASQWSLLSN